MQTLEEYHREQSHERGERLTECYREIAQLEALAAQDAQRIRDLEIALSKEAHHDPEPQ